MSELLKAFDAYHDFDRDAYFTLMYDSIASELFLEVPLKTTKSNTEEVLAQMNLSAHKYEIVFKTWKTDDSSNADFSKDFPFELLFKSLNKKSLIRISLRNDTLSVDFSYDCKDSNLEDWIITMNDSLRKKFGLSKTPTFKVLTKARSGFQTENVKTEEMRLNLDSHYNDTLIEIHKKIENAIADKKSGLVLLYGTPGTGKTTYIKSLITTHQNCNFIYIQNEFVTNLLDPDFIFAKAA